MNLSDVVRRKFPCTAESPQLQRRMIANAKKFNLEHCNNITNSAGRRVWGFMGVEALHDLI